MYPKWLDKFWYEFHTAKQGKKFHIDKYRQVQPNEILNHSTDDINTNPKYSVQDNIPHQDNQVTFEHIPTQSVIFQDCSEYCL